MPNSYAGLHAEYYDQFYADKPYEAEVQFIRGLVKKYLHKEEWEILDLACGSGRHAIEFSKLHHHVVGIDISRDLLNVAEAKAASEQNLQFHEGDMAHFDLKKPKGFDLIVCLFDSIGYLIEDQRILSSLTCARNHLSEHGLIAIEFWNKAALQDHFEPLRVRTLDLPAKKLIRIAESKLDPETAIMSVTYQLIELQNNGHYRYHCETQRNRGFSNNEIRSLLTQAGFKTLEIRAGYSERSEILNTDFHILTLSRKAKITP